jgi:hypothetical protein
MHEQNNYLIRVLGSNEHIKDGIELLKVWLHQRQLDVVSSLVFAVFFLNQLYANTRHRQLIFFLFFCVHSTRLNCKKKMP